MLALSIAWLLALSSLASYSPSPAEVEAPPLGIDRAKEGRSRTTHDDDLDGNRHEDDDDSVAVPRAMAVDAREQMNVLLIMHSGNYPASCVVLCSSVAREWRWATDGLLQKWLWVVMRRVEVNS
jgi:hypothetical protein